MSIARNRRAYHEYEIIKEYEAGIVLTGSEVKSVRQGHVQLGQSYGRIESGEVFLVNAHISPYDKSQEREYDPMRERKLLLKKREIRQLARHIELKGLTLVPTRIYFARGWAKVSLALGRGKKKSDKRRALREKDARREIERERKREV